MGSRRKTHERESYTALMMACERWQKKQGSDLPFHPAAANAGTRKLLLRLVLHGSHAVLGMGFYWGCIRIMEKKMESTIGFRV